MNENFNIQESLRNLPKHSLNEEQRKIILLKIKATPRPKRKVLWPIVSAFMIIALISILTIPELLQKYESRSRSTEHIGITAPIGQTFNLPDTNQEVIGIKDKVALLNVFDHFIAEDKRRISKLMIYFWGNSSELIGKPYHVDATNQFGDKITLTEGTLTSPLNGEDAHTLTRFLPFPSKGTWLLSFFVNGKIHGEFTVQVLDPFPKTENYVLVDSPKEMVIGTKSEIYIESFTDDSSEIKVKLINENGKVEDEAIFSQVAMHYDAETNQPVYLFNGNLVFPNKGQWSFEIEGERTGTFDNY